MEHKWFTPPPGLFEKGYDDALIDSLKDAVNDDPAATLYTVERFLRARGEEIEAEASTLTDKAERNALKSVANRWLRAARKVEVGAQYASRLPKS